MIAAQQLIAVQPGRTYRAACQLKMAHTKDARAYWMMAPVDSDGEPVGTNNIFGGYTTKDQDFKPCVLEFKPVPGTAAVRLNFIVAFGGSADAWVDDVTLTEVQAK